MGRAARVSLNVKCDLTRHAVAVCASSLPTKIIGARLKRLFKIERELAVFIRPRGREVPNDHLSMVSHARHRRHDHRESHRLYQHRLTEGQR